MIGWLRRRGWLTDREPLLVQQWKTWASADPQMPALALPAIKPLKARKIFRLHEVPKQEKRA